jgi:hypothetical protein
MKILHPKSLMLASIIGQGLEFDLLEVLRIYQSEWVLLIKIYILIVIDSSSIGLKNLPKRMGFLN